MSSLNKGRKRPSVSRDKQGDDKHKCRFCGHDGGKEEVVKQDNVCGIGGFACIDLRACSLRIRKRANRALREPIRRGHAFAQ